MKEIILIMLVALLFLGFIVYTVGKIFYMINDCGEFTDITHNIKDNDFKMEDE